MHQSQLTSVPQALCFGALRATQTIAPRRGPAEALPKHHEMGVVPADMQVVLGRAGAAWKGKARLVERLDECGLGEAIGRGRDRKIDRGIDVGSGAAPCTQPGSCSRKTCVINTGIVG